MVPAQFYQQEQLSYKESIKKRNKLATGAWRNLGESQVSWLSFLYWRMFSQDHKSTIRGEEIITNGRQSNHDVLFEIEKI